MTNFKIDANEHFGEGNDLESISKIITQITRPVQIAQVDLCILLYDGYCSQQMGWESWAKETSGNERRSCYSMRSIGQMFRELGEDVYNRHKTSHISKLDIITSLCEKDQREMLSDNRINQMTRDELRACVAEKLGKIKVPETEQSSFIKMFDEIANEELDEKQALILANEMSVASIYNSSCKVMGILEQASVLGRLAGVPQSDRTALAMQLRELATQIES